MQDNGAALILMHTKDMKHMITLKVDMHQRELSPHAKRPGLAI